MKWVMVTGGAGFIGSNLVDMLIERGYRVRVIDDLSTGNLSNLSRHEGSLDLSFIEKDINDVEADDLRGMDAVFHLGARVNVVESVKDPIEDARVNYQGTLNIVERCREARVKKILFTSSAAVYGDASEIPTSENALKEPLSPYGNHKYASENILTMYNKIDGMGNLIFRLFNVYGPRQDPSNPYSGVISKFMGWCENDRDIIIFGDGNQTRDFVYVMDVAEGLIRAYENDIAGTYNVGTSRETSINDLAATMIDITGSNSKVIKRERRKGEIYRSCCSNVRLNDALGWTPDMSIEEGLRDFFEQ